MSQERFERLRAGIIEAGQVLRGEREPAREFVYKIEQVSAKTAEREVWALCLAEVDDALTPRKVYEGHLTADGKHIGVTDDEGEAFVCPAEWFALLELPQPIAAELKKVA